MANIIPKLIAEIDPAKPVQEICQVISAITPYHPGHEEAILLGVKEAIDKRLEIIKKGANEDGKPILQPGRNQQNQG